jgi:hypothetical protein
MRSPIVWRGFVTGALHVEARRAPPDSVAFTRADEAIYFVAMSSLLQPLHLLLMMFAGWVNRHQLDVIDNLPLDRLRVRHVCVVVRAPPAVCDSLFDGTTRSCLRNNEVGTASI